MLQFQLRMREIIKIEKTCIHELSSLVSDKVVTKLIADRMFQCFPPCHFFYFRLFDIFLFNAVSSALHEQERELHEAQGEGQEAQQCSYNQLNQ